MHLAEWIHENNRLPELKEGEGESVTYTSLEHLRSEERRRQKREQMSPILVKELIDWVSENNGNTPNILSEDPKEVKHALVLRAIIRREVPNLLDIKKMAEEAGYTDLFGFSGYLPSLIPVKKEK